MIKGEEGGRADFMEEAGWGGDGGASGGRKVGPGREARRMGEPADPETGLRWPGGSSEVSFNSPGARDRALGGKILGDLVPSLSLLFIPSNTLYAIIFINSGLFFLYFFLLVC